MGIVDVGFNQRYDAYCMLMPDSLTVYRNCRILGMTGQDEEYKVGLVFVRVERKLGCESV